MNVADYMGRTYPSPPCWELVAAVLLQECGQEVTAYKTVNGSVRSIASAFSLALHKSPHGFAQIAEPRDFAVVLMGRTPKLGLHHAGIVYDAKVLHALDGEGGQIVLHQDMESLAVEYPLMEFWAKEDE